MKRVMAFENATASDGVSRHRKRLTRDHRATLILTTCRRSVTPPRHDMADESVSTATCIPQYSTTTIRRQLSLAMLRKRQVLTPSRMDAVLLYSQNCTHPIRKVQRDWRVGHD